MVAPFCQALNRWWKAGRRSYAMELSPRYVDVAVLRWQAFTGQAAALEATGEAFPG